ncbi:MAG TPA: branched-chain amino acid ABC transporter substrate-binding protein [Mycobacterium sp.]
MRLLRVTVAAACIVLIALAAGLIGRLRSVEYTIVAQAQIRPDGTTVSTDSIAPADPAGTGHAVCPPLSIAMAGALTGPDSEAGVNVKNGVRLAIEKHNAANAGCQVQMKEFDTGGDPARVNDFAPQIVSDAYTVGLIGPTFSGVARAAGAIFDQNRLPAATASASSTSLSQQGWATFFRAVASDEAQGQAIANYLRNTLRYKRICIVSDNSSYGKAMARAASAALGTLAVADCGTVDRIKASAPDAVLMMGSSDDASAFTRKLRDSGITATLVSALGTVETGSAANGALLACPCGPRPDWFAKLYRDSFGTAPGAYSTEGYDLATVMLNGIDAGHLVRRQMLDWMRRYDGQGVARRYQWTASGELGHPTIWIYKVQ